MQTLGQRESPTWYIRLHGEEGYLPLQQAPQSCEFCPDVTCKPQNIISNEYVKRKEILQSIASREFHIWQYKQYIL